MYIYKCIVYNIVFYTIYEYTKLQNAIIVRFSENYLANPGSKNIFKIIFNIKSLNRILVKQQIYLT